MPAVAPPPGTNSLEDGLPDLPVILKLMKMQHASAQQLFSAVVDFLLKAKEKEQQNHLVPLSIVLLHCVEERSEADIFSAHYIVYLLSNHLHLAFMQSTAPHLNKSRKQHFMGAEGCRIESAAVE